MQEQNNTSNLQLATLRSRAFAFVIDDLIVYLTNFGYRLVTNAGTADKDMAWLQSHANKFGVILKQRPDLSILAVQGPNAIDILSTI